MFDLGPCTVCNRFWTDTKRRRMCQRCCDRRSRKRNRVTVRAYDFSGRLKRRYGVSIVWYLSQVQFQNGRCGACGGADPNGKALSVDHDHVTGKVRGLLCGHCNIALGYVHDSRDRLQRLSTYLELS